MTKVTNNTRVANSTKVKVTNSTRVEAPKIISLDLRPFPTDADSRINETISLISA